jgi:hypothetical protein
LATPFHSIASAFIPTASRRVRGFPPIKLKKAEIKQKQETGFLKVRQSERQSFEQK